ncbi:MAG: hypothetical protein GTO45_20430, partial [Candidatus Aminicenantes bacterium]|nr:hypothetical protein [Candidatus Aminicenantes bacterium]NIM82227.1 hypothetical protein [Candidatus Aminicenantes bacterium]NIN21628.1 hypothetical protein [Candidatus Aminicenantes bacterium]NIN44309.1 hypothetical protein [Candidatus Aminicenantes bacterium]NIN87128.1 hypothetical protein [Candidatus Aminicenantes bacterium]
NRPLNTPAGAPLFLLECVTLQRMSSRAAANAYSSILLVETAAARCAPLSFLYPGGRRMQGKARFFCIFRAACMQYCGGNSGTSAQRTSNLDHQLIVAAFLFFLR